MKNIIFIFLIPILLFSQSRKLWTDSLFVKDGSGWKNVTEMVKTAADCTWAQTNWRGDIADSLSATDHDWNKWVQGQVEDTASSVRSQLRSDMKDSLDASVDGSTIERSGGKYQVKNGGIGETQLGTSSVTTSKITDNTIDSTDFGTGARTYIQNWSGGATINNQPDGETIQENASSKLAVKLSNSESLAYPSWGAAGHFTAVKKRPYYYGKWWRRLSLKTTENPNFIYKQADTQLGSADTKIMNAVDYLYLEDNSFTTELDSLMDVNRLTKWQFYAFKWNPAGASGAGQYYIGIYDVVNSKAMYIGNGSLLNSNITNYITSDSMFVYTGSGSSGTSKATIHIAVDLTELGITSYGSGGSEYHTSSVNSKDIYLAHVQKNIDCIQPKDIVDRHYFNAYSVKTPVDSVEYNSSTYIKYEKFLSAINYLHIWGNDFGLGDDKYIISSVNWRPTANDYRFTLKKISDGSYVGFWSGYQDTVYNSNVAQYVNDNNVFNYEGQAAYYPNIHIKMQLDLNKLGIENSTIGNSSTGTDFDFNLSTGNGFYSYLINSNPVTEEANTSGIISQPLLVSSDTSSTNYNRESHPQGKTGWIETYAHKTDFYGNDQYETVNSYNWNGSIVYDTSSDIIYNHRIIQLFGDYAETDKDLGIIYSDDSKNWTHKTQDFGTDYYLDYWGLYCDNTNHIMYTTQRSETSSKFKTYLLRSYDFGDTWEYAADSLKASIKLTIDDYTQIANGNTFTSDGETFVEGTDWDAYHSDLATCKSIANAFNSNSKFEAQVDDSDNSITIWYQTEGTAGNSITLTSSNSSGLTIGNSGNFAGAESMTSDEIKQAAQLYFWRTAVADDPDSLMSYVGMAHNILKLQNGRVAFTGYTISSGRTTDKGNYSFIAVMDGSSSLNNIEAAKYDVYQITDNRDELLWDEGAFAVYEDKIYVIYRSEIAPSWWIKNPYARMYVSSDTGQTWQKMPSIPISANKASGALFVADQYRSRYNSARVNPGSGQEPFDELVYLTNQRYLGENLLMTMDLEVPFGSRKWSKPFTLPIDYDNIRSWNGLVTAGSYDAAGTVNTVVSGIFCPFYSTIFFFYTDGRVLQPNKPGIYLVKIRN